MSTVAQVRVWCLAQPGAFVDHPFGTETEVIKIRVPGVSTAKPKMFALIWADSATATINLKCEPALAEQLRAAHPEITPGYHMSKKHWNTVDCAGGLDEQTIQDLIEDSYDLVVSSLPRAHQEALAWRGLIERG